jgi:hypothetical protein
LWLECNRAIVFSFLQQALNIRVSRVNLIFSKIRSPFASLWEKG